MNLFGFSFLSDQWMFFVFLEAYDMMVARAKMDIKKKHYPLFIRFAEYYVKLTWINGRYECIEWNEYRRQIATNDFSESYNNLVQIECGLHSPFFLFVSFEKVQCKAYCAMEQIQSKWI